jgi:pSer/pThr/pTyr-binding forkhead associated (FHA) protein
MELIRKIRIGSLSDNDLVINNDHVSDYHLELIHDNYGNIFITDLNSTHGTFLNNVRIEGFSKVYWGDRVTISGKFVFDWMKLIIEDKNEVNDLNNRSEIVYSELTKQKISIPVIENYGTKYHEDIETTEEVYQEHSNPIIQFYLNNSQIVNIFLLNLLLGILFYFAFLV